MSVKLPKYRLHKASGQALVQINGQRIYLGVYGSETSRQEYRRLIAEWLASNVTPAGRSSADKTQPCRSINELLLAFWGFAERYYVKDGQPTSELSSMREALRPLKELYGLTPIRDFGPLALKTVRQKMIEGGLCRTHINHQVYRIRRLFRWGVENEIVPLATYQSLQTVAGLRFGKTEARESTPVKPVAHEHVEAVIPHLNRQVAAMVRLQRLTGMRSSEVVRLRPCDIDASGHVWTYTPEEHKTMYRGHQRTVYFGPLAQAIIRPWLVRDSRAYCFSPKEAEVERNAKRRANRRTPMTPSQATRRSQKRPRRAKRDRYDRDSYRRAIVYAITKANVPHWHPHQLRHACGTDVRRQFGLDTAQIILGHKTASITEVYAEVDRTRALEVMAKIG
jgi:integrase